MVGVREEVTIHSLFYPEFSTVTHSATPLRPNKKLNPGQPLGGMSACRLGGLLLCACWLWG